MKRIKSFLRMKYEMSLMRAYDFIVYLLNKTRCDWYPRQYLDKELEEVWFMYESESRQADFYLNELIRLQEAYSDLIEDAEDLEREND